MHKIVGKLQKFNRKNGWYYVAVPQKFSKKYFSKADRGLVAISATVGEIHWETSMLPMGDGTHFVPISQKIRNKYGYEIGDRVEVYFETR